jgi:lysine 2,3-aminomutase
MPRPLPAAIPHADRHRTPTVGQRRPVVRRIPALEHLAELPVPAAIKPPVSESSLVHRQYDDSDFWRQVPAFADVSRAEFLDHGFQNRHSVTRVDQLREVIGGRVGPEFLEDVAEGMRRAPMSLRLSPYTLARINWDDPYDDPLRIQFLPVASSFRPDHPRLLLDSLHEQQDSPTLGLVHRYPDKVLFLAVDVCPVYCRFCTRSYAIGSDTETVEKVSYLPNQQRWAQAYAYLLSRPEVEDVVISGGDAFFLAPRHLQEIGETLLAIPQIRRLRFATKGPAVAPMKILTHDDWTDALTTVVEKGRALGKEVALHTHFNCPAEISSITKEAMDLLFERGIKVRNQSVLIRGVNDEPGDMIHLVKKLSDMNVQPYYVYQHDMVKGVEDLRTRLGDSADLERRVRGETAGFNTPTFVTDVPGGGGKRDLHSWDHYDETTGVSVYRSPAVDEDLRYLYFDPLHLLPEEGRRRWEEPANHGDIVQEALAAAGAERAEVAAG